MGCGGGCRGLCRLNFWRYISRARAMSCSRRVLSDIVGGTWELVGEGVRGVGVLSVGLLGDGDGVVGDDSLGFLLFPFYVNSLSIDRPCGRNVIGGEAPALQLNCKKHNLGYPSGFIQNVIPMVQPASILWDDLSPMARGLGMRFIPTTINGLSTWIMQGMAQWI